MPLLLLLLSSLLVYVLQFVLGGLALAAFACPCPAESGVSMARYVCFIVVVVVTIGVI